MSEISQRDYFERRFTDLESRVFDRFETLDSSIERTNELLKTHAYHFVTRIELEKLEVLVREVQNARRRNDGHVLILATWISIAIPTVLWVLTRLLH